MHCAFISPSCELYGCPCGFLLAGTKTEANGANAKPCTCTAPQIRRYLSKISGPLLDRIDIHIEVPRLSSEELMTKRVGECSAKVRGRVVAAREKQAKRLACGSYNGKGGSGRNGLCNAGMKARELKAFCEMDDSTKELLNCLLYTSDAADE